MPGKYRDTMEAEHAPDVNERRERFNADCETAKVAISHAAAIAEAALNIEDIDAAIAAGELATDAESRLAAATT